MVTLAGCPDSCAGTTQRRLASPEGVSCLGSGNGPTAALAQRHTVAGRLWFWQEWTATPGSHNSCYVTWANSSALILRLVWQSSLATLPFWRRSHHQCRAYGGAQLRPRARKMAVFGIKSAHCCNSLRSKNTSRLKQGDYCGLLSRCPCKPDGQNRLLEQAGRLSLAHRT